MSLKGIELQIAIPKTFEAGKVAEQKQQQSQIDQNLANMQMEKRALKNKETTTEAEAYAKANRDRKDRESAEDENEERRTTEEEKNTKHPYKGSFVDMIG